MKRKKLTVYDYLKCKGKRNAWVNIYNPGSKFDSFLKKQTKEMTKLMKKLGVI